MRVITFLWRPGYVVTQTYNNWRNTTGDADSFHTGINHNGHRTDSLRLWEHGNGTYEWDAKNKFSYRGRYFLRFLNLTIITM